MKDKKKWLNEEISESRLMDYAERQDEDVMNLGDDDWSLLSKKEGTQTWTMRHETNSSSCMKVWNSKSSGNMYSKFEAKVGVLSKVHFGQLYIVSKVWKSRIQASNSVQIKAKMKKWWLYEDNCVELKDH